MQGIVIAAALCLIASSDVALSQGADYPSQRTTTIVVPNAPGGATDIIARIISKHLAVSPDHQIIVENRGGANGNIGGKYVAAAAPNGHTLLLAPATNLIQFTRPEGYDPLVDLTPVALVADAPGLITISAKLQATTLSEFLDLARAKSGAFNFGSPGVGTVPHLSAERLQRAGGFKMTHVPYRGVAAAMVDLAGGTIQMAVSSLGSVQPFSEAGSVRIIAVTAKGRLRGAPEVPTLEELGWKGLEMSTWWGIMAPKATSPRITQDLNRKLRETFEQRDAIDLLARVGIVARSESIDKFADFIRAEVIVWSAIAKDVGISER